MSGTSSGELKSVLSGKGVLILAFGAMIGWGWIILSGRWINIGGPGGAITAFIIGAILVSVVANFYGELASAMPLTGGEVIYSLRALGPIGSFICSWALILGYISVAAFEAVALPSALAFLIPGFNTFQLWTIAGEPVYATWILAGVLGAIGITYLNYTGIRLAVQFQIIMTSVIALAGIVLVAGAITSGPSSPNTAFPNGISGILPVILQTPFMFVGFAVIPQLAEETDIQPGSLGKLISVSVFSAAIFYIAVIWGAGQALPGAELAKSTLPAAAAVADLFHSKLIGRLVALAGIAGILTSWNAFIMGGGRVIYALSEAGMLPEFLSKIHPEHKVPSNAILLIGIICVFAPFFGEQFLKWISNAGSLAIVVAWFAIVISFLVLRYREPGMKRPYTVPFGKAIGVFGVGLTAVFIYLYLPIGPSALVWPYEWMIILVWAVLGIILYVLSKRTSDTEAMMDQVEDALETFEQDTSR